MLIIELLVYLSIGLGIACIVIAMISFKKVRVNYRTPTERPLTQEDVEIVKICVRNTIKRQWDIFLYCLFWFLLSMAFLKIALVLIHFLPDKVPTTAPS